VSHENPGVGSVADTARIAMPSSSQTTHHGAIALGVTMDSWGLSRSGRLPG